MKSLNPNVVFIYVLLGTLVGLSSIWLPIEVPMPIALSVVVLGSTFGFMLPIGLRGYFSIQYIFIYLVADVVCKFIAIGLVAIR